MGTEPGYPVVESAPLNPLRRRFLRRTQRRAQELPQLVGGSVLVFQSNEKFALAPSGVRMLSSDTVLNATMVAVVLTGKRLIPAVATLPSVHPGRSVAIRAKYSCQVIDAVRVLEEGCWDIRPDLIEYLLEDPKLQMLGSRADISDNPEVHQKILAHALARKRLEPPRIPGIRVQLVDFILDLRAEDGGWISLGGSEPRPGYPDNDYGHDRYDDRGPNDDDQDDSYAPEGDER
jgi:hypothetical protein